MIVYSFWIGGELKPLNRLTIKSFQAHGHQFILYSYVPLPDAGCEVRDANEIITKDEIYHYTNLPPQFKFGGFAELLKATMLHYLGWWHVDMDVTCLKSFEHFDEREYVFRPHKLGAVGNIIKARANSQVTELYLKWASNIDSSNTDFERSIAGLYPAIVSCDLQGSIVDAVSFGMDSDKYIMPYIQNTGAMPDDRVYAIHWCGALGHVYNYEPGSFLDSLLKKYEL